MCNCDRWNMEYVCVSSGWAKYCINTIGSTSISPVSYCRMTTDHNFSFHQAQPNVRMDLDGGCTLFERSEFLIATSKKKICNLCVCSCVRLILVLVGNVLCTKYVCATLYDTRYILSIMYQVRMIPGAYHVPDTYVPQLPLYY